MMKKKMLYNLLVAGAMSLTATQVNGADLTPLPRQYQKAVECFEQRNFAEADVLLHRLLRAEREKSHEVQTDYMLAVCAFHLNLPQAEQLLDRHLTRFPHSPYKNTVEALKAATHFYKEEWNETLAMFNGVDLATLPREEREDATYRKAMAHLKTGDADEAAVWMSVLRETSTKYREDATYYEAYAHYAGGQYEAALPLFEGLEGGRKYGELAPYYVAEIALAQGRYAEAHRLATALLSDNAAPQYAHELHRILADCAFQSKDYPTAQTEYARFFEAGTQTYNRRDAAYRMGVALMHAQNYERAAQMLAHAAKGGDELAQTANLNLGLTYLKLAQKDQARMAFEQAAASDANAKIKEQAAYNYAAAVYETSFSGFGASVTAFENFLNGYPRSPYAAEAAGYLAEVYLSTKSYEEALQSINRISHPGADILAAKQQILYRLGTQDFTNGQYAEAARQFGRAISAGNAASSTAASALFWRGESRLRLEQKAEAEADFTAFLAHPAANATGLRAEALYNMGYLRFSTPQHRYAQAKDFFKQAVNMERLQPTMQADAYNRIGDCLLKERLFEEAKGAYAQAERLSPEAGDYAFYQMALVCGLQKDYAGKITLLNRLQGKYPQSSYLPSAMYEKGRAYVMMENPNQAIEAFDALCKTYPRHPLARKALAEVALQHYRKGNYQQAVTTYKEVVKNYPGSDEAALAVRDLKSIYVEMNRVEEFAQLAKQLPGTIHLQAGEQDSLTFAAAERSLVRGEQESARKNLKGYLATYPDGAFSLKAHRHLMQLAYGQKQYEQVLTHSQALLRYPDNPYVEEALTLRAEVLQKTNQQPEALETYQLLYEKASTEEMKVKALRGVMAAAEATQNLSLLTTAATELLARPNLPPEVRNEALYTRAMALKVAGKPQEAMPDWAELGKDTRTPYGAEARFRMAEQLLNTGQTAQAEKELLAYIEESTPQSYWLARAFVLLADVYMAENRPMDARQYLVSLQQNYRKQDNVQEMIKDRLKKIDTPSNNK